MNFFTRWRINRTKERIAALEECLPIMRDYLQGKHYWPTDKDALISATGELASLRVRLARLEAKP